MNKFTDREQGDDFYIVRDYDGCEVCPTIEAAVKRAFGYHTVYPDTENALKYRGETVSYDSIRRDLKDSKPFCGRTQWSGPVSITPIPCPYKIAWWSLKRKIK
jgi:hypothetical protein